MSMYFIWGQGYLLPRASCCSSMILEEMLAIPRVGLHKSWTLQPYRGAGTAALLLSSGGVEVPRDIG